MTEQAESHEIRRAILKAVREHLAASAPYDAVRGEQPGEHKTEPPVENTIVHEPNLSLVERFSAALEAVAGHCVAVRDEREAADVVGQIIEQAKAARIAISDSPLIGRVMNLAKPGAEVLMNASKPALFDCDVGITSAQWAVAETGTLVLESDEERHRLTSLVPPVHIALVEADKIRQTLAEVLEALSEQGRERLSRTVTFITGPSRTSDIELTLAIGVHGPGELFVIIIKSLDE